MTDINSVMEDLKVCATYEDCRKCSHFKYRGTNVHCKSQLLRDLYYLMTSVNAASLPAVNARFRTTTGDVFTVTKVEGPHCVVKQERTGHEYVYGIDALMRLPITWIEVWQE